MLQLSARTIILVVDDEPLNFTVAEAYLEETGATLLWANSGEQAIRTVCEQAVDLILMDAHMPGMSGIETTEKIRQLRQDIPVIAITADKALRHAMTDAGCVEFITKPFYPEVLFAAISRVLPAA